MPTILIGSGRDRGARFEFDEAVTLGRSMENQVRLLDSQISRCHARLEPGAGGWQVVDLGSRNGVRVAEQRVDRALLAPGDSFTIGSICVYFDPPEGSHVDPAGTGHLILLGEGEPEGEIQRRQGLPPSSQDPSETLDITGLMETPTRLEALLDVSLVLGRERDPAHLGRELARRLCEVLEGHRAVVLRFRSREERWQPLGACAPEGPGETIRTSRVWMDQAVTRREGLLIQAPGRCVLVVPLAAGGQIVGAVHLERELEPGDVPPPLYGAADLGLLIVLAAQAGEAMDVACRHQETLEANRALRRQVRDRLQIIGESQALREVVRQARRAARGHATVLVRGETGTGKELIARLVHEASSRHQGPFVVVNCAAIVEGLLESELFGHERGAFTGADRTKQGQFELASGGTLFLDEVGDMDPRTQKKLLRVLEERRFSRVGGTRLIEVDVRIVAATNRNLEEMVQKSSFREDLFYRLSVIPLHLPPLRERPRDIPALVEHYLRRFAREMGKPLTCLSPEAMACLQSCPWPGNIRQLRNELERAIVLADHGSLELEDLSAEVRGEGGGAVPLAPLEADLHLGPAVSRLERGFILRALQQAEGNKSEACRLLGTSRPTLDRKLRQYDIDWRRESQAGRQR